MNRQAGMTKLIIAFRSFAHAPENCNQTAGCVWPPASFFQTAFKNTHTLVLFPKTATLIKKYL